MQAIVSALLVLAAILAAFVPFAGVANPGLGGARAHFALSGQSLASGSESIASSTSPLLTAAPPTGTNFDYVLMIVMENKGICGILTTCGGTGPYMTSLANGSALAKSYRDCNASPSLPNYFCLTAASSFGCTTDGPPHSNTCTDAAWNSTNLVDRLEAAGLTWKDYQENFTGTCSNISPYPYAVKHNPLVYYGDIVTNASRCARVVGSGPSNHVLLDDLNSTATASNYMWFTPNLCHDMHDCTVPVGDAFLSGLVPKILNSPVFQTKRAALLITFDEPNGTPPPDLYTVWAGPVAKRGYQSTLPYNHFSTLRTIEANWNLVPLNGNDSAAAVMNEFFIGLPVARFVTSPTWPQGNTTVTFNASSSTSTTPNPALLYRWGWTNNGTWDTGWLTTPTAQHAYGMSGVHTAALQVQDSHGIQNTTTQVITTDDKPPVTTATVSGTRDLNGWYTGTVTITLAATDDRSGVAYTTYHLDGSASLSYTGPIVVTADGNHNITYHSADEAGNVEAHKTVVFEKDGIAPVTAATFSGTMNGPTFVTPIQVTLSATDATSGVAGTPVQIDGAAVTNYSAPFTISNVGSHSVQYHSVDVAGNVELTHSFSVVNGTVNVVAGLQSRALLNGTSGSSGWYTSAVTVTLQLLIGTSPPDSIGYRLDGGAWIVYSQPFVVARDGVHSLDFNATNGAGQVEVVRHAVIQVDSTAPATLATVAGTPGTNGWYTSPTTVSLTATDNTSGVANISYRIDGVAWLVYTAPFLLNEGRHTLEYHATTVAGLSDPVHVRTVNVDTTPPATMTALSGLIGRSPWYVSPVTVYLNASDATSGVLMVSVTLDGGVPTAYSGPFVLRDGQHVIQYAATDAAGLKEATKSLSVWVDTVAPATTAGLSGRIGANGWFVSNVTVWLNATDATSGVASTSYRIDNGPLVLYTGPFVLSDGSHVLDYFSSDHAGLAEVMQSRTIRIDGTPPATTATITGTAGANGWYTSNATVSLSAIDSVSGIAHVYVQIDTAPPVIYSVVIVLTDGTHVLQYYSVNGAGLVEATHSLSMRVDTKPPTTVISPNGTMGANGWYTSSVSVSLTATDATSGVAKTWYQVDNTGAWSAYTGPFVLGDGQHVVAYYSSDQAGLVEPMGSVSIKIDTTPPATTATVQGTSGSNGWYTSNAIVTLSASDLGSGVAYVYYQIDSGPRVIYSAPVTLTDGSHVFAYYAVNVAGLAEATHSLSVRVDTTPPTTAILLSGTAGTNSWYRSNVTVTLAATDVTSGLVRVTYRIDNGSWAVYAGSFLLGEGRHLVRYFATDVAGNNETIRTQIVNIDSSPPVSSVVLSGSLGANGWYVTAVSVNMAATDTTSGVATLFYRIDGGPLATYSGPLTLSDGRHVLDWHSTDVAGNTELTRSMNVWIDTMPPVTSAALSGSLGDNGWYRSNVTVYLNASDAMSGVARISYRLDNGSWQPYSGALLVTNGVYFLEYFATDVAGHVEGTISTMIRINTIAPLTTASWSGTVGTNGWYLSPVTVTLTSSDGTGGVLDIFYRVDGGSWTLYSAPLVLRDGRRIVDYYATDQAGNVEPSHTKTFSIDTIPPQTSVTFLGTSGANGWYVSNVSVTLSAADAMSGVAVIRVRVDGGLWQDYASPVLLGSGHHSIEFYAIDRAGLSGSMETKTVDVDTAGPVTVDAVSGAAGANGWYVSDVTVTLNATDAVSGVASTEYRLDGGAWVSYAGSFSISEGGTHILEFASVDKAGNRGPVRQDALKVETSNPYFLSLSEETSSPLRIVWDAADNDSGIAGYEVRVDKGSFVSVGTATSVTLNLTVGAHTIQVKAVDRAGQWTVRSLSFQVLSSSSAPLGSLFVIIVPIVGGTVAALAFSIWQTRRRRSKPKAP